MHFNLRKNFEFWLNMFSDCAVSGFYHWDFLPFRVLDEGPIFFSGLDSAWDSRLSFFLVKSLMCLEASPLLGEESRFPLTKELFFGWRFTVASCFFISKLSVTNLILLDFTIYGKETYVYENEEIMGGEQLFKSNFPWLYSPNTLRMQNNVIVSRLALDFFSHPLWVHRYTNNSSLEVKEQSS